ncbi:MAG: hypothetical protein WCR72_00080 [Bacteroidota bacterium]
MKLLNFITTVFLLVLSIFSFGQDCDVAVLAQRKTSWKFEETHLSPTKDKLLTKQKAVALALRKIIVDAYPQPVGCEARWNDSYHDQDTYAEYCNGVFWSTAMFFKFGCGYNNKEIVDDETGTAISISVNSENLLGAGSVTLNDSVYVARKVPVGVRDGAFYYQLEPDGLYYNTRGGKFDKVYVFTLPGKQPYIPMTRKEFLGLVIQSFKKIQQQVEKSAAEIKDPQWQKTYLSRETYHNTTVIAEFERLLINLPAADEAKPAIIDMGHGSGLVDENLHFPGFYDTEDPKKILGCISRENRNYYDKKLLLTNAQLIAVHIEGYNASSQVLANVVKEYDQKMDFKAIGALMGK